MKYILLFIILVISLSNVYGQSITWQRMYAEDSNFFAVKGINTLDGGYILLSDCGYIGQCFFNGVSTRARIIKIDKYGAIEWQKVFFNLSITRNIIQDLDSGYLLSGGGEGAPLMKLNKTGDSLWYKEYGSSNYTYFVSMKLYLSNGYIAAGTHSVGQGSGAYITRIDSNGNLLWDKIIIDTNYRYLHANDITIDTNNNIAIIGEAYKPLTGYRDVLFLKFDPSGNLYKKQIYFTSPLMEKGINIFDAANNQYAVSLWARYPNSNIISGYLNLDTSGRVLTQKIYNEFTYNLSKASDNTFVLAGAHNDYMALKKIDIDGNEIWTKIINDAPISSFAEDVESSIDGGFLLSGWVYDTMAHKYSIYLVKTDSNGNSDPLIGIKSFYDNLPDDFNMDQNYPNPFNNSTSIKFYISKDDKYEMRLYDLKGSFIKSLFNKHIVKGIYEINLNKEFEYLPSSVYFIKLSNNIISKTIKCVLIK